MKANLTHSLPCAVFGHNYFKANQLNFPFNIECRCCGHTTTDEELIISGSQSSKIDYFQLLIRKLFCLQIKCKTHKFSLHHS